MKKNVIGVLVAAVLAGCSAAAQGTVKQSNPSKKGNLVVMDQVKIGMTTQDVKGLMKDEITVGYQKNPNAPNKVEPIKMKNPSRTEVLSIGNKSYEVFYYFIHAQKADGIITDDEVVPFVFDNNRLVGKSWDYLLKLRSKQTL